MSYILKLTKSLSSFSPIPKFPHEALSHPSK